MGAFYVLPCTDAATHYMQASGMGWAEEAGKDCNISYTNALCYGVYPCFISEAVDVDTTCFAAAWSDESYELMRQAGGLVNRALLAYHRGLIDSRHVSTVAYAIHMYFNYRAREHPWEIFRPLMPILNWEPAPGGADALAALHPLFPHAPPAQPEG